MLVNHRQKISKDKVPLFLNMCLTSADSVTPDKDEINEPQMKQCTPPPTKLKNQQIDNFLTPLTTTPANNKRPRASSPESEPPHKQQATMGTNEAPPEWTKELLVQIKAEVQSSVASA
jgi:hypothetical protein